METHRAAPIVVGIDGSSTSVGALRWAALRAALHKCPLHLVYAVGAPADPEVEMGLVGFNNVELRAEGEEILSAAARIALEVSPDIEVVTQVADPEPAPVLIDRSLEARMVVVGTRGLGAVGRGLLGSVTTSLARHAHCPVAAIPHSEEPTRHLSHLPVVVGVDGSPRGKDAVDIAFAEASRIGVGVVTVTAWSGFLRYFARARMRQEARSLQSQSLAGRSEHYPDVPVIRVVAEDQPARRILAEADNAQLIVVGSHGRGGFAGTTLGSVAHAVVRGSRIPVIIARTRK